MDMKIGAAAIVGLLIMSSTAALAKTGYEGTWTLNVAQSKYPPGFPTIRDHHMNVTKDDGKALQYTDNFIIGDAPATHVTFDGAYDGKDYKMTDPEDTSAATLRRAVEIGRRAGLRYVYAGNLPGKVGDLENTR